MLLVSALSGAGLLASGCGQLEDVRTVGETEGLYIDINDLRYQVQISRVLNPNDPDDRDYLAGVPEAEAPKPGETYFGVFLRVQNTTKAKTAAAAEEFEIVDTDGEHYEPIELPESNIWAYEPTELGPGELLPSENSAQFSGTTRGALLLFRLGVDTLQNRPLEFEIHSPVNPEEVGTVALDV
ncbi:MAG: hypothetical protein AVDCRST_MAG65-379 [uncultured Solirubrobacteraceae bacterium]|uniref:DUF4352 domain-containing protein n=1 Tax=uncultured Solirubrobacteraceae bacterium TaxID=1162706 RepID=A0A6J4R8A6_9ACTN|nr:MAG: hypothetical protein AVDCRST_MAG65-379 [uncultured Solirubrobacteraceae bacterium]